MDETFGGVSSVVESSLYHNVHSILRELDCQPQAGSASNKGMLRWTLHNRVERCPSVSVPLVKVLIKELEKAERIDSKIRIIPLLHTLVYTILQSAFIPEDVYHRIHVCLKSLVTLPLPYCAIAMHYARQIKMEQTTPADVEGSDQGGDTWVYKRKVVLHTLMAGIGKQCNVNRLAQALEHLGEDVELHFQDVVAILEQRVEDGAAEDNRYKTRLQEIYRDILTAEKGRHILTLLTHENIKHVTCFYTSGLDPSHPESQAETHLPNPEVSFHVWHKEDDIWNELVNFALMVFSERNSAYLDEDDVRRNSVVSTVSTDSGIEGDMPISEISSLMLESQGGAEEQSSSFCRRPCVRWPKAGNRLTLMMEAIKGNGGYGITKEERNLTARIVVMGDDRTLGRLAKTLHTIRKREARHLLLTKRVNQEIYYIPVTNQLPSHAQEFLSGNEDMLTLAGYLGSVDPWFDCNINGLGAMIPKLAQMIVFSNLTTSVEEVFVSQLQIDFPDIKRIRATFKDTLKGSVRYKKHSSQELYGADVSINYRKASISDREQTVIRAVSVNIRVLENKTFSLCLDKDPRRTYKDVQSIDVSPCLDPGYCPHPSTKSKYSSGEGSEPSFKFLNRTLTLPINTFFGTDQ
ncbi:Phosphoinositide 3-kinase regulatory subunit 6 [Triplophysa tibetana]|uniref:Phosphoinositide 3-kinase regulatory subunit 6 n=1 Tax=Triplophysa tibetana TaxID=1572043 RepID=A0A5A9N9T4_9TELE|nr:Phosphoinositide 3-kinase regulatory subunit 6 [Triplophysa tibetana]